MKENILIELQKQNNFKRLVLYLQDGTVEILPSENENARRIFPFFQGGYKYIYGEVDNESLKIDLIYACYSLNSEIQINSSLLTSEQIGMINHFEYEKEYCQYILNSKQNYNRFKIKTKSNLELLL